MEANMSFSTHLHNGDPLTDRTKHVPEGRPKAGKPPFTWEESARDALMLEGLARWKEWTIPGTLYKLEAYNGWGYRDHHPGVLSPYLWSFSNHYARGKYVGDGQWSATAVSRQCGAAVLLKRLEEKGQTAVDPGPVVLELANPHMTGPIVKRAQRLLKKNKYGKFSPGDVDGEYGPLTADAVRRAKWELGYPPGSVNTNFGPNLQAFLDGSKTLPASYQALRTRRQKAGAKEAVSEAGIRKRIVDWARWGCKNTLRIAYSENGPRLGAVLTPGALPLVTDCSAFATLCYSWANAPNPNASGPYSARQTAYTGTMLHNCRHIPQSAVKPGDLVAWTPPSTGHHVCIVVTAGRDPLLVSHGQDKGPVEVRFSDEHAYQRRKGHGTVTWLSVF
jgi:hypothetical protein